MRRNSLEDRAPIFMQQEDWIDFETAKHCHICEKDLVKEKLLDSLSVYSKEKESYCGQSHKKCFFQ